MQAKELETELDQAFVDVEYQISVDSCKDHDVCRQTCLMAYPVLPTFQWQCVTATCHVLDVAAGYCMAFDEHELRSTDLTP